MRYIAFFEVPPEKLESYIETWNERVPQIEELKFIVPPSTLPEPVHGISGCVVFEFKKALLPPKILVEQFLALFVKEGIKVTLSYLFEDKELAKGLKAFRSGEKQAAQEWKETSYPKFTDIGSTQSLSILPLIDWHVSSSNLRRELGVSYLVLTDENTILFDMGLNIMQEDPSPLLQNMKELGIEVDSIDSIVISHHHGDHSGGGKWVEKKTFSLSGTQGDLRGKRVFTPVPLKYPGITPLHTKDPTVVGRGVATIGCISNAMFLVSSGIEYEQALAVNVENKGIVVIVGCGHQTLPKILERTEALFDEPIYGIIGGLHYPVEGGPIDIAGMSPYKYFGTGKVPWEQITRGELTDNIDLLKQRKPKVVALSPHDSSPLSLEAFRQAFPNAYRDLKVGEEIRI
ncbi:MAG: MBL fold metallo-hydrolase [Candidatus Hermodarchaeota archaeon]|nr:MBL fold metallo-hydrolase [Candidatus Hermodarchaeota archaeon]